MMSWKEAKNYCKNKNSELLMEQTTLCKRRTGGGEWLGLRRRWMFRSVSHKTGIYSCKYYLCLSLKCSQKMVTFMFKVNFLSMVF